MEGLVGRSYLYREGSLGSLKLPYHDGVSSLEAPDTHFIKGPEGRLLAAETSGKPGGHLVVLYSGNPGCRYGPTPNEGWLIKQGVRLITYDRPGYGESDPHPGRRPVDSVADMEHIIDHFGGSDVSFIGRSGGGPHALACAAKLSGVRSVAVLASPAPRLLAQHIEGFGQANAEAHQALQQGEFDSSELVEKIQLNPDALLNHLWKDLSADDKAVIKNILPQLLRGYAEAVRPGPGGWDHDFRGLYDWGFDPRDITVPTLVWYGGDDRFTPPVEGQWLVNNVPTAQEYFVPEAGHFRASTEAVVQAAIGWCLTGEYRQAA